MNDNNNFSFTNVPKSAKQSQKKEDIQKNNQIVIVDKIKENEIVKKDIEKDIIEPVVEQYQRENLDNHPAKLKGAKRFTALVLVVSIVFSIFALNSNGKINSFLEGVTVVAVAATAPQANNDILAETMATITQVNSSSSMPNVESESPSSDVSSVEPSSSEVVSSDVLSNSDSENDETPPSSDIPEGSIKVESIKYDYGNQSYDTGNGVIEVLNKSQVYKDIDIGKELSKTPDVSIYPSDDYKVLIYHTHTSEAYQKETKTSYLPSEYQVRTDDFNYSVVGVGNIITEKLNKAGIKTLHDTTFHDSPMYNGAYNRSLTTLQKILAQYPSIELIIDLHRDALGSQQTVVKKPLANINGKNSAQIMLISGCDDNNSLGYPDWEINLRFSLMVQRSMTQLYPDLARPMLFKNIKYNQHICHGAFLAEIGSDGNSFEEVAYAGELFADCLLDAFKKTPNQK